MKRPADEEGVDANGVNHIRDQEHSRVSPSCSVPYRWIWQLGVDFYKIRKTRENVAR